jgi:hypothetical protein
MIVALGLLQVGLLAVKLAELMVRASEVVVRVGIVRIALNRLLKALCSALIVGLLEHLHPVGILLVRDHLTAAGGQHAQAQRDSPENRGPRRTSVYGVMEIHGFAIASNGKIRQQTSGREPKRAGQ